MIPILYFEEECKHREEQTGGHLGNSGLQHRFEKEQEQLYLQNAGSAPKPLEDVVICNKCVAKCPGKLVRS